MTDGMFDANTSSDQGYKFYNVTGDYDDPGGGNPRLGMRVNVDVGLVGDVVPVDIYDSQTVDKGSGRSVHRVSCESTLKSYETSFIVYMEICGNILYVDVKYLPGRDGIMKCGMGIVVGICLTTLSSLGEVWEDGDLGVHGISSSKNKYIYIYIYIKRATPLYII